MAENNFEKNITRLEEITALLEEGKCSLSESLKLYEEGMKLSGECNDILESTKQKITMLSDAEKEE